MPVWTHQDRAPGGQAGAPGIAGVMAYLHESLPPALQARDARALGGAEEKKVMARAR
jgi:hypothetical protein